ncbi:MAG: phenylalanine--tRNA ligase subunit beta, partial [Bacteroidetes bacterium]
SMGMICAEDELGLGPEHEGIMVLDAGLEVGTSFKESLQTEEDYVIEIDLTPNRIDAASHYGVARDLAAYMRTRARLPQISLDPARLTRPNPIPVTVENPELCKRYVSVYIEGVQVTDSPEWMQKRLKAIGLRPINNIVDITNYVLMELGQPMHAFDADQLQGGQIIVKTLPKDQPFITLDEQERQLLAGQDLMICDAERPLCIGGIMGGINSGVTHNTRNVFLEVAYFDPGTVRRTSKRLGINSDSSFRYERGADPNMPPLAALRAASLMAEITGGTPSQIVDLKLSDFPPYEVDLSIQHTNRLIGKELSKAEIVEILSALEIKVEERPDGDTLHLQVPPYRVDVQRPQDVIEEVLRVHGYNQVEVPSRLNASINFRQYKDRFGLRSRYADYLSANGYYEILTNSLVGPQEDAKEAVKMVNPLSEEQSSLRTNMLPGMLEVIRYNQNRQEEDLALYEFGKTYHKRGEDYEEREWLTLAVTGRRHPKHWQIDNGKVSLFTLTKEAERLQRWFRLDAKVRETQYPDFDYGLELVHQGRVLARYGKVKSALTQAYDIRNEVFFMLIDLQPLLEHYFQTAITFEPIPMFPAIRRDISLLIDRSVSFAQIQQVIQQANPRLIRAIELHDVYKGKGIPQGKKSYLVSILLRDDKKTLEDATADKVCTRVYQLLEKQLGAEIRGN